MSYEDMSRQELLDELICIQDRAITLNKELCNILDMDWIWLSKKPLDALLKWQEKFEAYMGIVKMTLGEYNE